jgi:hypothetical protein
MTEVSEHQSEAARELASFQTRLERKHHEESIRAEWFKSLYQAQGVDLPYDVSSTVYCTEYFDYPTKWDEEKKREVKDYGAQREINVPATNLVLARVTQHASKLGYPVNKNYNERTYTHEIVLVEDPTDKWNNITVTYSVNRESVCKKVVTGTKHVEEVVIPAHDEEVTEWECKKVSFLGMDLSDADTTDNSE